MKKIESKLLYLYRDLPSIDQHALIRFAEFLSDAKQAKSQIEEQVKVPETLVEPVLTTPKENESVVGALKRLTASYPMIDKAKMLDQTSNLMSEHLLRGKAKEEVIQAFEILFEEHYKKLTSNLSSR